MLEARTVSGSAKAVLEFAREARRLTSAPPVELSIMTFSRSPGENSLTRAIRNLGVPLDVVPERGRFDTGVISHLQRVVQQHQPHVVWSNSVKSHFLVRSARLHRVSRWVAFHHGYTTTDLKMRLYNQLDRWSLRAADRVLTSSAAFIPEMSRAHIDTKNIRVQHMPIRPSEHISEESISTLRSSLGFNSKTRVLLSVGRLSHEKGHADLIKAFAIIRKSAPSAALRLVVVGDGPERPQIEGLCRSLGLEETVILAGQQDDVNPYYALADVFVLPSHSEGSPNVLLEAMAAGVPVVATAVGGIPEIVTNQQEGLLVPKCDITAMASAVVQLLHDPVLCERLVSSGLTRISQNTPEAYFSSMSSVFIEAVGK